MVKTTVDFLIRLNGIVVDESQIEEMAVELLETAKSEGFEDVEVSVFPGSFRLS